MSALAAVVVVLLAGAGVLVALRRVRPPARAPLGAGAPGARARRWRRFVPWRRRNDRPPTIAELAVAVDELAAAVRGGASLTTAVVERAAKPDAAGRFLALVAARVERGASLVDACAGWTMPGDVLVPATITLVAANGGAEAGALDTLAEALRERHELQAETRVQSAQARLSALVVAVLPVAFTLWALVVDPRAVSFLFTSPVGWLCLATGLGLEAVGAWWMRRITQSPA